MSGRPPANRMMLQMFKARLVGAKKGHGLLKKKRDALKARFQQMLREIISTKRGVVTGIKDCSFSMAKCTWATGGVATAVLDKAKKPSVTLSSATENVAGVYLPKFLLKRDAAKDTMYQTFGVGSGGQVIQSARAEHMDVLSLLVSMASLQTSFVALDNAIMTTSRRVNALEYVVVPRIEDIIAYIKTEMDEMEREEFFRVKKVVNNKRKQIEIAREDAEKEAAERGISQAAAVVESAVGEKDPDIIF